MSHYLSLILFTPLAGALLLLFVSKQNEDAIRWIANAVALAGFAVSVPLWFWYDPQNPAFQFQDRIASITEFELYVQVNSSFAESHNEATLKLAFEPGKRTSTAALDVEALSGLLHALKSPAGPLGDWTLTAWLDGNPHLRLDPHAIQDVLLVCRYKCA